MGGFRPNCADTAVVMARTRSGSGTGSGRSSMASAKLNMDAVVLLPMAGKQTAMAVKTFFSQRSEGMIDGRQHGTSSRNSKSKREGARAHRSDPFYPRGILTRPSESDRNHLCDALLGGGSA